jgi:succinate-semialdehyde dehydrogenase/glutarate-semialdehyde dehydrogenase
MIEMGVDYVNFTGSTHVGLNISEMCGRRMIPCSMELGGKNPAIVCADADIDRAAASIVFGGLTNAGQTCASVGRVYAHAAVYDGLVEKVVGRVRSLRVGNPLTGEVDMGPMVDPRQLDVVEHQVRDAVSRGARVLAGGRRMKGPGQFFEPTVVVDVTDDMLVIQEETFGPVIPIMKVDSDEEALEKANDSEYGLTAYVFSEDADRSRNIAKRLEAGTVMVNETLITFGFPETPWQGVKMSGTGRTHSDEGFLHLCYPYHVNEDSLLKVRKNPLWQPYSHKMYRRIGRASRLLFGTGFMKNLFSPSGR